MSGTGYTIDGITGEPTQEAFLNPNHVIAPYLDYTIDTFYTWNNAKLQIPIAETPPTLPGTSSSRIGSEVVTSSAPVGKKIVLIKARRVNTFPVLPDPDTGNTNETLESANINPRSPAIMGDMKSRIFEITAQYVYILSKPVWVAGGEVSFPITDVDGYARSKYAIGSLQFVKGLI